MLNALPLQMVRISTLAIVGGIVWGASLLFIFPGFFDPFWPNHSDAYIFVANSHTPNGLLDQLAGPRPVSSFLLTCIGWLGPQGFVGALHCILLLNLLLTLAIARRAYGATWSSGFVLCAALFFALVVLHPYQYVFGTYDATALLAYFFLSCALLAAQYRAPLYIVFSFLALSFLSKETYYASALFLFALQWFEHRDRKGLLVPAGVAVLIAATYLLNSALQSRFVTGDLHNGPYAIDLNPSSVLNLWIQYSLAGLNWAHLLALAAVVVAACWSFRAAPRILAVSGAMLVAGFLALLPNSIFPNHYFPGYAFEASYFLFAPIVAFAALPSKIMRIASICGALIAVVSSVVFVQQGYSASRWAVEQQMRQARIWRSLTIAAKELPESAQRVVVSGINFPFSPFDHSRSLLALNISEGVMFDVLSYGAPRADVKDPGISKMVDASIPLGNYDAVWALSNDGTIVDLSSVSLSLANLFEGEVARYPALASLGAIEQPPSWYNYLSCGTALIGYEAWSDAERCLRRSIQLYQENPYPYYYLGGVLERLGRKREAIAEYAQSVSKQGASPNPAFEEALKRVSQGP